MHKIRLAAVCPVALAVVLAGCGDDDGVPPPGGSPSPLAPAIAAPAENETVGTFAFSIRIVLPEGRFDPATLEVQLNGAPVSVTGGPTDFTASIDAGPPLRDDNVLLASALLTDGSGSPVSTRTFRYLPPKARARRITDPADLVRGPLAHGTAGDYLLENTRARFVVQDAPKRDLYSVGAFGGNLIDAELVDRPGTDNFLEIQPAVNIETVINAQTVEIVNDGQDGLAAVVRTCGPDDILDFVNPSTVIEDNGMPFPAAADDRDYEVEGCTEYALEPGTAAVRMTTTLFNNEDEDRGFLVGDFLNASGELEQWTTSGGGIGELLTSPLGLMSYIGYGEATGVDYALVPLPIAGSSIPRSTFFSTSGVSYVMQSNSIVTVLLGGPPTFVVPAGGSHSYTRYFGVGDGSGGNAVALEAAVKGTVTGTIRGCVTAGGVPAVGARVAVLQRGLASQFVTGLDGCYGGAIAPGNYRVAAALRGFPYEGGGSEPILHAVAVAAAAVTVQDIALPATGRLRVRITAPTGAPLPARVSVVGFDPSPEATIPVTGLLGTDLTGVFNDATRDAVPFGLVWLTYAGTDGLAEFDIEPGTYDVVVSRGSEYSTSTTRVTAAAGALTTVDARLARVIDTRGFVSSDFHVHGINSADSRVSHTDRAMQFAGEGVENIIMTDHHAHTDLMPGIADLGLESFVRATIGEEITTWDYGHFNAYPLLVDPTRPSRGSTDWAVGAPAGRDFPAYGSYSLPPAAIAALATTGPTSTNETTIQINHIDSFFAPLRIDTTLVPPRTALSPANRQRIRLDPDGGELFHHFPALELWNGAGRGAQREFLQDRIGIWMNHLNQGLLTTAIADTDTHDFRNLSTAGARTWTASSTDDPAAIDPRQVAGAVRAGKAVGGQGVYVQTRLRAADGSGGVADFGMDGTTLVRSATGALDLDIVAQAPRWAPYDRIEVYANAATVPARWVDEVPVLFGAEPTLSLEAGSDFAIEVVDVEPAVPGAERYETRLTLPFTGLDADTWFVVVVRGTEDVSPPMFPVMALDLERGSNETLDDLIDGNLGERGVLALGFTNALYADVDGAPGFHAPRAP